MTVQWSTTLLVFLFLFVESTLAKNIVFRRVSEEYNRKLQSSCANPDFMSESENPEHKIMHGNAANKGEFPWAVALVRGSDTQENYCGATLISNRHIITARHCVERWTPTYKVMVGGVCDFLGPGCSEIDMVEVPVEFVAYLAKSGTVQEEYANTTLYIHNMNRDLAIIQLKQDLVHHFNGENVADLTRPACLPKRAHKMPSKMQAYGWGTTEELRFSPRLMEVELDVIDLVNDPIVNEPEYLSPAVNYSRICVEERLYCMHSTVDRLKDGAGGDSGSGIVGRVSKLGFLYGTTIAGSGIKGFALNIGIRMQSISHILCYYTGVCAEKEWVGGNVDPSQMHFHFTNFYDTELQQRVDNENVDFA